MSEGVRTRSYGFEGVVSVKMVVQAADGRSAREIVERMLDGVSAELTSGPGTGLGLRDVRADPAKLVLSAIDGADPTAVLQAMLDGSKRDI